MVQAVAGHEPEPLLLAARMPPDPDEDRAVGRPPEGRAAEGLRAPLDPGMKKALRTGLFIVSEGGLEPPQP